MENILNNTIVEKDVNMVENKLAEGQQQPASCKDKYIAPDMEVIEMEPERMMINSIDSIGLYNTTVGEEEQLVNGRRGRWGNLWYEGIE